MTAPSVARGNRMQADIITFAATGGFRSNALHAS